MSEDTTELQRQVAHAALDALREHPFALAGSGAIREHGFIRRLSHDVDLFSNDPASFGADRPPEDPRVRDRRRRARRPRRHVLARPAAEGVGPPPSRHPPGTEGPREGRRRHRRDATRSRATTPPGVNAKAAALEQSATIPHRPWFVERSRTKARAPRHPHQPPRARFRRSAGV